MGQPTADRVGGPKGSNAMSIHEHRTGGSPLHRAVAAVVAALAPFCAALFAAKAAGLVTDNPWLRLAAAMAGAVVVAMALPEHEEERGRP
ncbi:hypothetical protein ACN6AT_23370 [Streptomyces sp. JL4002]